MMVAAMLIPGEERDRIGQFDPDSGRPRSFHAASLNYEGLDA
jgi:hypothetical protein